MSRAADTGGRTRRGDVRGGDEGAGCLIDCSAGLRGRKAAAAALLCGVCASEAGVGSPGAAAVRGAGPRGGRAGTGPGRGPPAPAGAVLPGDRCPAARGLRWR